MADDFYTVSGLEVKAVGDAAGNNGLHRKQYKTGTINKKKQTPEETWNLLSP